MAVIHPDDGARNAGGFETADVAGTGSLGRILNRLGALASIALAGGLTVWGCQMAVRDASGVSVVRAPDGPMRVAPQDPGGRQAAHQGLSVNAIAAGIDPPLTSARLTLAPPPQDLVDEDIAQGLLDGGALPFGDPSFTAYDEAVAEALATTAYDTSGRNGDGRPLTEAEGDAQLWDEIASAPVPAPRPRNDSVASVESSRPGATSGAMWVVQFGTFDSPEAARADWEMLAEQHSDVLDGRTRVIRRASEDGRIVYRLLAAGFDSIEDADRFCAAFPDAGQSCVPVEDSR